MTSRLDRLRAAPAAVARAPLCRGRGTVGAVTGPVVEAGLPGARVGDGCRLEAASGIRRGEVVGFAGGRARILVLEGTAGLGPGVPVAAGAPATVAVGDALLGRVVDATGRAVDGGPPLRRRDLAPAALEGPAPAALGRPRITRPLPTGVRVLDGLLTFGVGQRVGLFAGPGVGKSTLLGDVARGADADVVVVALVGERGREVREVLEGPLAAARPRSVVVVATGDAPALLRARAPATATAIAEHFRDRGRRVLLLVDSLTRYARALREVGLAAGEAPVRGGFPPSVFAALPRLVERAGAAPGGAITAVYTVLQEDEAGTDPVADEVRGLLDGHVVLARRLAERGQWPAVDVPASISRVASRVATPAHARAARVVRARIAAYEARRELVVLGAYERGGDPDADAAVDAWPAIEAFLAQDPGAPAPFDETTRALEALAGAR